MIENPDAFYLGKKRNDTVNQVMHFLEKDCPTLVVDVRLIKTGLNRSVRWVALNCSQNACEKLFYLWKK